MPVNRVKGGHVSLDQEAPAFKVVGAGYAAGVAGLTQEYGV